MSSPSPTLDAQQQVFALSMLANRVSDYTGNQVGLQQQMQCDLSVYLSGVPPVTGVDWTYSQPWGPAVAEIGNWELVWGPVVLQEDTGSPPKPTGVADNAMFVAYCADFEIPGLGTKPTYVVAIAATNPISSFDWLTEDGDVGVTVDFTTYDPNNITPYPASKLNLIALDPPPLISMGTAIGVSGLLTKMPLPPGSVGYDHSPSFSTLEDFLASVAAQDAVVIFTGHSLAGALSPTLALYLKQNGTVANFGEVLVYATAGATPGNAGSLGNNGFAGLFNQEFTQPAWMPYPPAKPYQLWNHDLWNTLDVVPHAWAAADLLAIPGLYGTPAVKEIEAFMALAEGRAASAEVLYHRIQDQSLQGTVQTQLYDAGTGKVTTLVVPPASVEDFMMQLLVQHVNIYMGLPGHPGSSPEVPAVQGLILNQPLPKPNFPPSSPPIDPVVPSVSGVTAITTEQMINDIVAWIVAHA